MSEPKVINVVSGKGGTGKSLLTAVLGRALANEGRRVLIVDLDIFVRGLTVLLTESGKKRITANGLTVTDLWADGGAENISHPGHLAIESFVGCDVLPAVLDIGAPFDFNVEEKLSDRVDRHKLKHLLGILRDRYDVVLLDNRAGLDRFIVSSCEESDAILAIAEDDDVSLQTNANLINHLRYGNRIKSVYTIINKARRIHSYKDIIQNRFRKVEFNYIGLIPFDSEVMDDFGSQRFWSTVFETLYFRAVIDAWNNLATRENLPTLSVEKYRFPPRIFQTPGSGRYPLVDRILLLYGMVLVLLSPAFTTIRRLFTHEPITDSTSTVLSALTLIGALGVILGIAGLRRILLGPPFSRDPEDDDRK